MRSPTGPTWRALQQLRASCVYVSALADAIIYDGQSNVANSLHLLPQALRQLQARTLAAIEAVSREGT